MTEKLEIPGFIITDILDETSFSFLYFPTLLISKVLNKI